MADFRSVPLPPFGNYIFSSWIYRFLCAEHEFACCHFQKHAVFLQFAIKILIFLLVLLFTNFCTSPSILAGGVYAVRCIFVLFWSSCLQNSQLKSYYLYEKLMKRLTSWFIHISFRYVVYLCERIVEIGPAFCYANNTIYMPDLILYIYTKYFLYSCLFQFLLMEMNNNNQYICTVYWIALGGVVSLSWNVNMW